MIVGYLLVVALLALVFFILIFHHFRQSIAQGRPEPLGFIRVALNWLLLIVFVGSLGGAGYITFHNHKTSASEQHATKSSVVSSSSTNSETSLPKVSVKYSPDSLVLTGNSVTGKFTVAPQTKLTIKGHYSGKVYKTFKAHTDRKVEHFSYDFIGSGTYDLVAKRGHKTVTKRVVVKDGQASSSSSHVVSSSSHSVSSSSSSVVRASSSSTVQHSTTGTSSSTHSSYSTPTTRHYSTNGTDTTGSTRTPTSETPSYETGVGTTAQ